MATKLHGKDGSVKVGGSAVAFVDAWDATIDVAQDDTTSMDSGGWQELMAGIKKVTGSIKVRHASGDTVGQTVLKANAIAGSAVVLTLLDSGTANPLSGTAFLNMAVSAPHDKPEEATYNFSSNGPWTYT